MSDVAEKQDVCAGRLLTVEQWEALGPRKAADYLADRHGYDDRRREQIYRILLQEWDPQ